MACTAFVVYHQLSSTSGVDAGMTLMISLKARGMNLTFLHWP